MVEYGLPGYVKGIGLIPGGDVEKGFCGTDRRFGQSFAHRVFAQQYEYFVKVGRYLVHQFRIVFADVCHCQNYC